MPPWQFKKIKAKGRTLRDGRIATGHGDRGREEGGAPQR